MITNIFQKTMNDVYAAAVKNILNLDDAFPPNANFKFMTLSGDGDGLIGEIAKVAQKSDQHLLISVLVDSDVPYHTLILSTLRKETVSVHEVNLYQDKNGSVSLLSITSNEAWAIYNHVLKSVSKPSRQKIDAGLQRAMENMASLVPKVISIDINEDEIDFVDFLSPDKTMH